MNIYQRAENNGVAFETSCVATTANEWDSLMKGHTRANRVKAVRAALQAGVIDETQAAQEIKKPYYNPYKHFKTKTHIIYVHSGIEHFIRVF